MKIIKDSLTGRDNSTYDVLRILGAAGGGAFLFLAIYWVVVLKGAWDAMAYGTGFAALIGAVGAALWMKRDTEPSCSKDDSNAP